MDKASLNVFFERTLTWLAEQVLIMTNLYQISALLVLLVLGYFAGRHIEKIVSERLKGYKRKSKYYTNILKAVPTQLIVMHQILLLWIAKLLFIQFGTIPILLNLFLTLLIAWFFINVASSFIFDNFWSKFISGTLWLTAALQILGVLKPMLEILEKIGFTLGGVHLTVLSLMKASLLLFVSLTFGRWLSNYLDTRIKKLKQLTPSAREIVSKTVKASVYFVVGILVLNSVGIDFTALTFFGSALGLGIGFGLQKIISNLISGIILLTDHSIKPGDVVLIGEDYGWISQLRGRYVSIITRDGHEYLVPNEDLITQQVINWSYSDSRVRVRIPFGVSYNSDPHLVQEIVLSSVKEVPRVLSNPVPVCLLVNFGDSSLDMELRVWIEDPKNGIKNLQSEILFLIWDTLKANNISIPFPQRDIHIKSSLPASNE